MTTDTRGHGGHATNKTQSANAISNWQLLITNAYAELHVHGCTHVCPDPYLFAAPVGSDCKGRANPPLFLLGGDNLSKPLPRLRIYRLNLLFLYLLGS